MTHNPPVWRRSSNIAGELDLRRIKARGKRYARVFFFRTNRRQRPVRMERLSTPLMDHPGSGSNVRVTEGREVLLDEINKTSLALQQSQQLESRSNVGLPRGGWNRRRWRRRERFGVPKTGGDRAVDEDLEKTDPCEPEAGDERELGHDGELSTGPGEYGIRMRRSTRDERCLFQDRREYSINAPGGR